MKIVIDVDTLQSSGILSPEIAATLRRHALRETGSLAINLLLAFGAIVFAAGGSALVASAAAVAFFGCGFILLGYLVKRSYGKQWSALAAVWMITGALALAVALGWIIKEPLPASIIAFAIFGFVGALAESRLLIALTPLALSSALGGSTGYWHATYMLSIQEPTITIVLFSLLAYASWRLANILKDSAQNMAIIFARMCVILVNLGFWIGSLWGDAPGHLWHGMIGTMTASPFIPSFVFIIGWALALLLVGIWGAHNGRRFIVNTVAVFGAIHFYTQWFEHLGAQPFAVMLAGIVTIGIGIGLWRYNRNVVEN